LSRLLSVPARGALFTCTLPDGRAVLKSRPAARGPCRKINQAKLDASMTACILLAWLRLLVLDGDLAKAERKMLRYRVLHAAARLVRGGRRRWLKITASWPWATAIPTARQRINTLPKAP
jgi:hypothetical protein